MPVQQKNVISTPDYAKSNNQIEASNKTILNNLKGNLDAQKELCVEELNNFLGAYKTTPQMATCKPPFSLWYGAEAILPMELLCATTRTDVVNGLEYDESLAL